MTPSNQLTTQFNRISIFNSTKLSPKIAEIPKSHQRRRSALIFLGDQLHRDDIRLLVPKSVLYLTIRLDGLFCKIGD